MVRARVLRNTAEPAERRQLAKAADQAPIPVVYGEDRVGALILNVTHYQGIVYVQCLWAHQGDSVNDIKLSGRDLPPGSAYTNYDGSQSTADSALQTAMSANGYSYSETLAGYMYSVVKIPISKFTGDLNLSARIKGRKVLDTRTSTTAWSDNPALCLRDFLTNTTYGCGKNVVASTVNTVADLNDALVSGTEKRRIVGVTFATQQSLEDIVETLRAYAGCFLTTSSSGIIELVGDTTRSTDATYSHASGNISRIVSLTKKETGNVPTVVEVVYTNTSVFPWRDAIASVEAGGVAGGTVPRRVSQVPMPGIRRHSQATREATERLNKLRTSDLRIVLEVFDAGIKHQEGDVIEVTHPIGLSSKKFRILAPEYAGPGLWRLTGDEYDPAAYSDSLAAGPTYADTDLISPPAPPVVNMQQNADFTDDLGWGAYEYADARSIRFWTGYGFGSPPTLGWGRNYGSGVIWNLGRGGCWTHCANGTNAVGTNQGGYIHGPYIPVQPGLYYEASVLASIHRSQAFFFLRFHNSAKTAFSDAMSGADIVDVPGGTGFLGQYDTLEDRPRLWRFGKAPVTADGGGVWSNGTAYDAAYVTLICGLTGNGTGVDPYIFWHQVGLFCHGTRSGLTEAQQTPWVDYNAPTVDGGQLPRGSVTDVVSVFPTSTSSANTGAIPSPTPAPYGWEVTIGTASLTNNTAATIDVQVGFQVDVTQNTFAVTTISVPITVNGTSVTNPPYSSNGTNSVWFAAGGLITVSVPSGQTVAASLLGGGYSIGDGGGTWSATVSWQNCSLSLQGIRK
jgi:hypothetical protein